MATIEATIRWLDMVPELVGAKGYEYVRGSIISHDHIVTGRMLNSVHYEVNGPHARIWVWTKYAGFVNDGRGEVRPVSKKALSWDLPYPLPHPVMRASAYPGSHFFDEAYEQLDNYCASL